jgi:hypothetical protein
LYEGELENSSGFEDRRGVRRKMSAIFVSHASEDKSLVVRPLAELLQARGYEVWYDEFSLKLGDSLRRRIDSGLAQCAYGIVVLSHNFFSKEWPQRELDALTTREASEARKLILPVWHAISAPEIASYSPMLADKVGVSTDLGLETVVERIVQVLGPSGSESQASADGDSMIYNFGDRNVLDWRSAVSRVFNTGSPSSKSWSSLDDIIKVLRCIAEPNLNHCFFPDGGGLDLEGVARSHEEGCLELRWSRLYASIVKPKELRLEVFPGFPSLSYFRLEADSLDPWFDDIDSTSQSREELAELAPLDYRERWVVDAGYYDHDESGAEIPTPRETRVVTRYFRGAFVFFAKGSAYNGLTGRLDGYNAQHNTMTASAFRGFIADLIREASEREIELEPDRR